MSSSGLIRTSAVGFPRCVSICSTSHGSWPHGEHGATGDRAPRRCVYDKLLRATDDLEAARELIAAARDYHHAKVVNDQNEVTKRLTMIAAIVLPPTFIVGLYGQNFSHIPELQWAQGYGFSWALIVLVAVGALRYFRRRELDLKVPRHRF